ncbi:hypothetical protein [Novosphingobium sp. FSW06-99]|uniref:hypothetical protein n=1 Tax=Novosphingobium sp. FSW06-99 TaxID=1739113 RepID=UPI000AD45DF0|nr:hypothetical protein [Novosphingobium sp. FSW06-99]
MTMINFKGMLKIGVVSLAALCVSAPALAANDPLTLVSKQLLDKVTTVDGKVTHQIVDPSVTHDKVVPGSHIVVVLEYHNNLAQPISNFEYKDPLPAPLMLSDDSAGEFDVSVDGGKTFGKLSNLVVTDAKGATRAAEAGDVTTVKLVIPQIAPGASGKIEFHATVR